MPSNIQSAAGIVGTGKMDVNSRRPFLDRNGNAFVLNAQTGKPEPVANATLLYDEWKDLDRAVIGVAVDRLVGIADLRSRGLVHNLGTIGVTVSQWEESSDITEATISMAGTAEGEKDTVDFSTESVPVPIVHKDYHLNMRRLEASRRMGEALDVTMGSMAGRVVAEKSEDMLFGGSPITVEGGTIYGYTTHPDRATVDMGTQWDQILPGSNDQIITDVQNGLQNLRDNGRYGPYTIYIPGEYEGKMDEDYDPDSSDTRTVRERIMQLSGVQEIKVADRLSNDNVVIVELSREVTDLAIAQDISNVEWETKGGMQIQYKAMAVWVPRVKSDYEGNTGVCHIRPAP